MVSVSAQEPNESLERVLDGHASPEAREFLAAGLSRALGTTDGAIDRSRWFGLYTAAGRRFARAEHAWDEPARDALRAAGYAVPEAVSLSDLARACIVIAALERLPRDQHVALLTELMQTGDTKERIALLRSLCVLPEPERFVEIGVEACRNHVQTVLEAIACDNAYPAQMFSDLAFNQLVMKAVFVGVPLERVVDWRRRSNPELLRMAQDFAAERRAAGRLVPDDVDRILEANKPEPTA